MMSIDVRSIPLDDVHVGERVRALDPAHVKQFRKSFKRTMQIVPITITEDGTLVDGWHRLEAARALKWETINAMIITPAPELIRHCEVEANTIRKTPTTLELEELWASWEETRQSLTPRARWQPQERNCEGCGRVFLPKHPNNRFCTPECRIASRAIDRAQQQLLEAAEASRRTCEGCGKPLTGHTARARYCSTTCRTRTWKQSQAAMRDIADEPGNDEIPEERVTERGTQKPTNASGVRENSRKTGTAEGTQTNRG